MKLGGGGLIEVLKVAINASVFPEKEFEFNTNVMAGNAFKYCWPHRKQELKLH